MPASRAYAIGAHIAAAAMTAWWVDAEKQWRCIAADSGMHVGRRTETSENAASCARRCVNVVGTCVMPWDLGPVAIPIIAPCETYTSRATTAAAGAATDYHAGRRRQCANPSITSPMRVKSTTNSGSTPDDWGESCTVDQSSISPVVAKP